MNKLFAAGMTVVVALVLVPVAAAGAAREAQERYNYAEATPGPGIRARWSSHVTFDTYEGESLVRVVIADQTGRRVQGSISQDTNGDGDDEHIATFCGSTRKPVAITPGIPVEVGFLEGERCADDGIPMGTTGSVTATFTG